MVDERRGATIAATPGHGSERQLDRTCLMHAPLGEAWLTNAAESAWRWLLDVVWSATPL